MVPRERSKQKQRRVSANLREEQERERRISAIRLVRLKLGKRKELQKRKVYESIYPYIPYGIKCN